VEEELGSGCALVLEIERLELGVEELERGRGGGVEEIVVALARARCGIGDGGSGVIVLIVLLLFVGRGEIKDLAIVGEEIDGVMGWGRGKRELRGLQPNHLKKNCGRGGPQFYSKISIFETPILLLYKNYEIKVNFTFFKLSC
jgi:hypothetical protein